jgi:hypothetical protein
MRSRWKIEHENIICLVTRHGCAKHNFFQKQKISFASENFLISVVPILVFVVPLVEINVEDDEASSSETRHQVPGEECSP